MIDISLALRSIGGQLLLAPVFLAVYIALLIRVRQMQLPLSEAPETARQLVGYRIGSYLVLILFLVSLLSWVGLVVALRFNWSSSDVRQIEIAVRDSPDKAAQVQQVVRVHDGTRLSQVFDGLATLRPDDSGGHEHAVGKSYVIRLQRSSDGQWSRYRVKVYPDSEPTGGGLRMVGVNRVSLDLDIGWTKFNLGYFQAPDLGNTITQLIQDEGGKKDGMLVVGRADEGYTRQP